MSALAVFVGLCVIILAHFIYKHFIRKWRNEPPGPWGIPILGYSVFLKPRSFKAFMQVKSKYPDIVQMDFGQQKMVFLNSYETFREALVTKGDNFSGRQVFPILKNLDKGDGITLSEGDLWKEHRRFALKTLRDFGLGRNRSEEITRTEIHQLLQLLDKEIKNGDHRINIMDYLLRSVSNVICTLTMGEQPCYENEEVLALIHKFRESLSQNPFTFLPTMFPTLFNYLAPLFLLIPQTRSVLSTLRATLLFLQDKIDKHEKVFDTSQQNGDYIDAYLEEKHKHDSTTSDGHSFTAKQLKGEIFDLFLAGTDTTSSSLSWGLLYLAVHPDIQLKCHVEINSTIGREKQPIMRDKEGMPYVQAVLDEIQRYAAIIPMGVTRRNFHSDTIHGYNIAEDSLVVPFIYGVHHDPRVWEKPEQFYPEHFLTKDMDGMIKYKSRQELIPFSIGKRECLGESLAKMELFLFFVSILQKYEVRLPEMKESDLEEVLLGTDGSIRSPGHHELLFYPY